MKCMTIAVALMALAGCYDGQNDEVLASNLSYEVRMIELKGHEYLVYIGSRSGCLIHSESCRCKRQISEGSAWNPEDHVSRVGNVLRNTDK